MGKNFRETLNEQMKDPEFRAEWEAQEPERQIMHAILEGRQNCNLTQEQLRRTLMPVGEYEKPQIRRIAEEAGLPVAHKSDSQDICFVPDHDYASFIENETGKTYEPGNFVDESGNILGRHKGLIHYRTAQRAWNYSRNTFIREGAASGNK